MEVSFVEMREIAETLPIGLYARRRIVTELSNTEEGSYYIPAEDKIVISFPLIAEGLKNLKVEESGYDRETAIRSMLYHEVSHAILTPPKMRMDDIYNIFEDERIETLLENFYLDTNFKKNVLMINGGKIVEPKDVMMGFYNLVRFRVCPKKEFVEKVANIIERYKTINRNTNIHETWDYERVIRYLFEDYCKWWKRATKNRNLNNNQLQALENRIKNGLGCGEGATQQRAGQGKVDNSSNNANDGQSNEIKESAKEIGANEIAKGDGEKSKDKSKNASVSISDFVPTDLFKNGINGFIDTALTTTLENIITSFNKRTNSGSGFNAYSGVFNPRATLRNDYRYFERVAQSNGNNRFGKCHLNLFLDCSSSFEKNENKANTLIKSLIEIEKRNKNFTFDTIFCGSGLHEVEKNKRWLKCDEGTEAEYDEVANIMKKHNLANTYNYNIVLYDGHCYWHEKNPFLAWDRDNVTLIIERGNFESCRELKTANVIKIKDENYVDHLTEEVIKVLNKVFS